VRLIAPCRDYEGDDDDDNDNGPILSREDIIKAWSGALSKVRKPEGPRMLTLRCMQRGSRHVVYQL
jgi:hypothetical protein